MDMLSLAFGKTPESEKNGRAGFPRSFPLTFLGPTVSPNKYNSQSSHCASRLAGKFMAHDT